ncbi:related to lipase 1 [Ramularia collo-cygni]|uniref:Related to lipase 1 n=1 Tax=Ramularia collo-cygni TaxID=112498 RepID=A0A2D3V7Q9_9PEZI|nr:related to lipase 1 [Ramularia collo-cygni]CZT25466.1 related to lipase 1 [Ramularia collo-cygni]
MRVSTVRLAFVALVGLASAAPQGLVGVLLGGANKAPLPSDDPFYTAPSGYESAAPGAILRSRPVPSALSLFQTIPLNLKGAWQFLYRTTDSLGNPIATVTTVLVPNNADPEKLISYQVAEDSGGEINCAPSYTLQTGTNTTYAGTGGIEAALIAAALNQGWIVVSPDWEGPKSTFVAGKQAGYATLDSIRAALASGATTSVSSKAKVQMWGYSGGALASEFAAELQTKYAPEIPFVGMAIGGVTPNVENVFNTINKGPFAGLSAAGFLGLGNAYPDFGAFVQQSLKPEKADAFNQAGRQCFYADVKTYAGQDVFTYFKQGKTIFQDPIVQRTIKEGATMGLTGTPTMPIFVYKSVRDEISPIADTDKLVQQFCNAGVSIDYVREELGEHFTQAATSVGDIINFLIARFNGVPQSGCTTRTTFNDLLNSGNVATFGPALLQVLLNAVGVPLGPNHF